MYNQCLYVFFLKEEFENTSRDKQKIIYKCHLDIFAIKLVNSLINIYKK